MSGGAEEGGRRVFKVSEEVQPEAEDETEERREEEEFARLQRRGCSTKSRGH